MTHQQLRPPAVATPPAAAFPPHPGYHWTTRKARIFLGALGEFGKVAPAARAVEMTRQSAYRLRARLGEGLFARAWDHAVAEARAARRKRRRAEPRVALAPESDIFGLGK